MKRDSQIPRQSTHTYILTLLPHPHTYTPSSLSSHSYVHFHITHITSSRNCASSLPSSAATIRLWRKVKTPRLQECSGRRGLPAAPRVVLRRWCCRWRPRVESPLRSSVLPFCPPELLYRSWHVHLVAMVAPTCGCQVGCQVVPQPRDGVGWRKPVPLPLL